MIYPKEFITIQFKFAEKVSDLLKIPLINALFEYTSLPKRIGIPFSFMQIHNPLWQEFIEFIGPEFDLKKAYEYYQQKAKNEKFDRPQFGCFSYDYLLDEKLIKLHLPTMIKTILMSLVIVV